MTKKRSHNVFLLHSKIEIKETMLLCSKARLRSQKSAPSSHNKDKTDMIPKEPMTSRYQQIFFGHCYSCNNFGHMARECKLRKNAPLKVQKQRKGWKKIEVVKQKDQRFLKYKGKFFGYCHCCHKFGHKVVDCRIKGKDQSTISKRQRRSVSKVPHGKMRRKSDYKDS